MFLPLFGPSEPLWGTLKIKLKDFLPYAGPIIQKLTCCRESYSDNQDMHYNSSQKNPKYVLKNHTSDILKCSLYSYQDPLYVPKCV